MAYTYGTPASTTLSETVATSFERVFIQGADGNVKKGFKKFAQSEKKVETYSTSLPTLASGTMSNGAIEAMLPAGHFFRISRSVIINITLLNRVNRKKRLAVLTKNGREYCFMIPLANIRKLEKFLE